MGLETNLKSCYNKKESMDIMFYANNSEKPIIVRISPIGGGAD